MYLLKLFGLAGAISIALVVPPKLRAQGNPPASANQTPLNLREVMLRMSVKHPRVRARARALAAALKKSRFKAGIYPDPRIGVFRVNGPYKRDLRFIRDQTPMSGIEYRLSQAIPFPGRLTMAAGIADEDAALRRLELALEKNRVALEFLELLVHARAVQAKLKLTRGYAKRMSIVADAARTRYSVGKGNLADVSRADLKARDYEARILSLRAEYQADLNRLAYYLGDPIASTDALLKRLEREHDLRRYLRTLRRDVPEDAKTLKDRSPVIALARTRTRRAKRGVTLANMNYLPDFEVHAAYRKRAYIESDPARGENFMSFGLTVRVPLWSGIANRHRTAVQRARVEASRIAADDVLRRETSAFQALKSLRLGVLARMELYAQRLIPAASRARDSARLAYETGKVDFDVFLNSWDALYLLRTEYIDLEASARRRLLRQAMLFNAILPEAGGTQ